MATEAAPLFVAGAGVMADPAGAEADSLLDEVIDSVPVVRPVRPDFPALRVGALDERGDSLPAARPDFPTLRVGTGVVAVESVMVGRSMLRRVVPSRAGAEAPADDPAESVVSAWATAGPAANAAPTAIVATPAPSQP